jgi:hypothetical protein
MLMLLSIIVQIHSIRECTLRRSALASITNMRAMSEGKVAAEIVQVRPKPLTLELKSMTTSPETAGTTQSDDLSGYRI